MDNLTERIKEDLKLIPHQPGSYQMYDEFDHIIYVGKAKDLYNRVHSYFTGAHDAKTTQMVSCVKYFKYIVTKSELESFLLEINLIKENRPKYNILLMDDKSYPFIEITNEDNPKVIISRNIKKKKRGYTFGPYPNVYSARLTVDAINKLYPFRKCSKIPNRKCLYYDMGLCLGPCINKINKDQYNEYIKEVSRFLNGTSENLINKLKEEMIKSSDNLEFERALEYRNLINNIEQNIIHTQTISLSDEISRDVFGYYVKNDTMAIQVFHLRHGELIERHGEVFDIISDKEELLAEYIYNFYLKDNVVPKEILIPYIDDDNRKLLEELLNTNIYVPVKGIKKELVDMAYNNAKLNIENLEKKRINKLNKTIKPLEELASLLNINYPKRIEMFDNSNISGTSAVSAMVTYIDGTPSKKDYRKYNVKTVVGADDYHTMMEVLERRYSKIKEYPDLLIMDGGIPQVSAAKEILNKLNVNINLIGLAKDDKHRTNAIINSNLEEIELDKHSNLYLLLEQIQDEVHRFAITFFRNKHTKTLFESSLDNINGIGKVRKELLFKNFDSIEEIKTCKDEKLKSLGFPDSVIKDLKQNL